MAGLRFRLGWFGVAADVYIAVLRSCWFGLISVLYWSYVLFEAFWWSLVLFIVAELLVILVWWLTEDLVLSWCQYHAADSICIWRSLVKLFRLILVMAVLRYSVPASTWSPWSPVSV